MLNPKDMRYKHRESDSHQMHRDLGEFALHHLKEMADEISKREYSVGNRHTEVFVYRGDGEYAEFEIMTECFYGRREVSYASSDSTTMYHFTLTDI